MSKLVTTYYSSNGTFVAPAGVTRVYLLGHGGGAGADGGRNTTSAQSLGGCGTIPYLVSVDVVPNTSYSVTIGTGGTGGVGRTTSTPNGGSGNNTLFGALYSFLGAPATNSFYSNLIGIVYPETGGTVAENSTSGFTSNTGTYGTDSGTYKGGKRGAGGYSGSTGGNGGNGNNAGVGVAGTNGTGFGSGGGSGGAGSTGGGIGGNGAPGQLWVMWVE